MSEVITRECPECGMQSGHDGEYSFIRATKERLIGRCKTCQEHDGQAMRELGREHAERREQALLDHVFGPAKTDTPRSDSDSSAPD